MSGGEDREESLNALDVRWRLRPAFPLMLAGYEYPGRSVVGLGVVALAVAAVLLGAGLAVVALRVPLVVVPGAAGSGQSTSYVVDKVYAEAIGKYTFSLLHTWNARTLETRLGGLAAIMSPQGAAMIKRRYAPRQAAATALDMSQAGSLASISAERVSGNRWVVSWTGTVQTYYGVSAGQTDVVRERAVLAVEPPTKTRPTFLIVTALTVDEAETVVSAPATSAQAQVDAGRAVPATGAGLAGDGSASHSAAAINQPASGEKIK